MIYFLIGEPELGITLQAQFLHKLPCIETEKFLENMNSLKDSRKIGGWGLV